MRNGRTGLFTTSAGLRTAPAGERYGAGRLASPQGLGPEGAAGAEGADLVKDIEHGRQAHTEHLLADVAQQLGHEDPADAGEASVVVAEAGAPGVGFEPVDDLCHVAALVASPRVAQQRWFAYLQYLAVNDAAPAGLGLGQEPELRTGNGGEPFRPAAGAGHGPQRDERRVGHRAPDLRGGIGVVTDDVDLTHGISRVWTQ